MTIFWKGINFDVVFLRFQKKQVKKGKNKAINEVKI